MSTWEKNLDKLLAEGNHDSSDMIGYGYFLIEDSNKVFLITSGIMIVLNILKEN